MKKLIFILTVLLIFICIGCANVYIPKGEKYDYDIENSFYKPRMVETFDIEKSKFDCHLYCIYDGCDSTGHFKQKILDCLNAIIAYCEEDYNCEYDTIILNPYAFELYSKTGLIGYVYAVGIDNSKLVKCDLGSLPNFQSIDFKIGDTYFLFLKQMKDVYLFVPADYKESNICYFYDFHTNNRTKRFYSEIIDMNWTCDLKDVWKYQYKKDKLPFDFKSTKY